jgi:transcriptional regulator with XRE-family HTH domain
MSRKRKLVPKESTDVGKALMEWRQSKGWSRRRAAAELGINHRTLESWEYGYRRPPGLIVLEQLWAQKRRPT